MGSLDSLIAAFGPLTVMIVVGVLAAWAILMFLMPFFVYGAWARAKQCAVHLEQLVQIARAQSAHASAAGSTDRVRQEEKASPANDT